MADLSGVDAKIRWAKRHLAEFHDAVLEAFSPDKYEFVFDPNVEDGKHTLRVFGLPETESDWTLLVGDCLQNFRSALDHLAYQLVLREKGKPTNKTQFPIQESPFNKKGQWRSPQLQPEIRDRKVLDLLEEVQPYFDEYGRPQNPDESFLWVLRCLNNIDKHRLLLVVASVFAPDKMWWGYSGESPVEGVWANTAPLKDGDPVAWFKFRGGKPPPDFDPNPTLEEVIREPEAPRMRRLSARNGLGVIEWTVEYGVVERFRPFF